MVWYSKNHFIWSYGANMINFELLSAHSLFSLRSETALSFQQDGPITKPRVQQLRHHDG
jgi:hypothetical protein